MSCGLSALYKSVAVSNLNSLTLLDISFFLDISHDVTVLIRVVLPWLPIVMNYAVVKLVYVESALMHMNTETGFRKSIW